MVSTASSKKVVGLILALDLSAWILTVPLVGSPQVLCLPPTVQKGQLETLDCQ